MKYMGLNEIREKFISFFESKGHLRLPSFPLVPHNDTSLLLINSGMAPMKKFFTGEVTPPSKRVTTCQKCIRTPDIERVGKTARHGTYFEMLGNFSFGDYFKVEACNFAWEFCTKVMELPIDKLYVSVYMEDEEAFDIWTKKIGVAKDHMVHLGKEDNFWEHGAGPCGPCSEIYFDRGEKHGCGKETCFVGCDCDRYVEFWNLVFTQFENDGNGNYTPLAHPNIDTGMGLERLASILQGVDNLFEVDTVRNIMKHISDITGVKYGENAKNDVSLRVITDHIRSVCFMIGDGVLPSNEGRGYVLRRLLRRSARHGKLLSYNEPFLYKVADTVIAENEHYKELKAKSEYIKKVIISEEEKFAKTIDKGSELLVEIIDDIERSGKDKVISGESAFKLYDTYGFPIDLIEEMAFERSFTVNEDAFAKLMEQQKIKARNARSVDNIDAWITTGTLSGVEKSEFMGYMHFSYDSVITAVIKEEKQGGEDGIALVLKETPFYSESGGQVSDIGFIRSETASFKVEHCKKDENGHIIHYGVVEDGVFAVGDSACSEIDKQYRLSIMRNHTCVHLIQAALRKVLGDHVHQAGSLVEADRLRFDFSHFSAMTSEEITKTETIVNEYILAALDVNTQEMSIDEAMETGAMALFGEKYGDIVRVVSAGDVSTELCGGTHVSNTSNIGLCRILSEVSAASGVRRIEAVTGFGVLNVMRCNDGVIAEASSLLKAQSSYDLVAKITASLSEIKELKKENETLNRKIIDAELDTLKQNGKAIGEFVLITAAKTMNVGALRQYGDRVREKVPGGIAVIANEFECKGNLLVVCGDKAIDSGFNAGQIVKELAAMCGGNGGGRRDSAMAGAPNTDKFSEVLEKAYEIVSRLNSK